MTSRAETEYWTKGEHVDADAYRTEFETVVRRARDDIVEDAAKHVLSSIGDYAALSGAAAAEAERWLRRAASALVDEVSGDAPAMRDTLALLGALRARDGEPAQTLLDAFDTLAMRTWTLLLRCAKPIEAAAPVAVEVMEDIWSAWERLVRIGRHEILRGHGEGLVDLTTSGRKIAEQTFVESLVVGAWESSPQLGEAASRIGYRLSPPHGVILAFPSGPAPLSSEQLGSLLAGLPGAVAGPIKTFPREHVTVLLSELHQPDTLVLADEIARKLGIIMVVHSVPDLFMVTAVVRRILAEASLLELAAPSPKALGPRDLSLYRVLSRAPVEERLDFVVDVLGPALEHARWEILLSTAAAFIDTADDRAQTTTAEQLGLHPKTVYHRVRALERAIGLSFGAPRDALCLSLAVRLGTTLVPELRQISHSRMTA